MWSSCPPSTGKKFASSICRDLLSCTSAKAFCKECGYTTPDEDSMTPSVLGQEEGGLTATVNKDLLWMGARGTCIPLLKPVTSREPPFHLESGHAQSLVIQRGYEHQATLAQTGLSRNQRTAERGSTSTDALATNSEAQIDPLWPSLSSSPADVRGAHNSPLTEPARQGSAQSALTFPTRPGWPWQDALRIKLTLWNGNAALVDV